VAGSPRTPVAAEVTVRQPPTADDDGGPRRAVTSCVIGADEPVFAGHYPGFPIFPGVCLIECVHRSSLATVPLVDEAGRPRAMALAAVESSRFLGAVYPGDRLTVEIAWTDRGDGWRAAAKVRGERGEVASVRLRYRLGGQR
jgi:3-hydroxyacyl-[acyl-carrier-protein] dehydratase